VLGGRTNSRVKFVFDESLKEKVDEEALKKFVLSRELREADDYSTLTATKDWWDDWQDVAEVLYYSAEHVFSDKSPYKGKVFMPHIWMDMTYGVSEVVVEYADLSDFYAAVKERSRVYQEPAGTEWTLLSANDGLAWAKERYAADPDQMVVIVTSNEELSGSPYSYYFLEEEYGEARGFAGHYFNTRFHEWPAEMQQAEGLTPHDLPIWMHFAFLNGEWDPGTETWRLFPNGRWGGYEDQPIYFIEGEYNTEIEQKPCNPLPERPASHYWRDEHEYKSCLDFTQRIQYDWYRLWRHAFNVPSFPFWWSEKVAVRALVVDLREYKDGKPEYEESDVIDWVTVEDSIKEANPLAHVTIEKFHWTPNENVREILVSNLVQEAAYPMHSKVDLVVEDGSTESFTMDWHYHFDIAGLPGMQTYLAEKLGHYFGKTNAEGMPLDYNPFAAPYSSSGKPFVIPAIFFLTPHDQFDATLGGWTTNTGDLICIFAKQFGYTCEQVNEMMEQYFGQPVGPNLMAWSDAYCLWWEVFVVDWTYTPSPVKTLRWMLDPEPFTDMLKAIPTVGPLLLGVAPSLFSELFGSVHPWATGFPFWLKETLADPQATALSRQFASYQFAESIQHNIGYKHQTTVIFESPYLGMEQGFDYIKHKDLKETFQMTAEQISMPFYSTEPGSRDFPVDANSYMTHKMGAGTRRMLQRIFARREVVTLHELLVEADATFADADPAYRCALEKYDSAVAEMVGWRYADAYASALAGLVCIDELFTARGAPDRVHSDWYSDKEFTPAKTGMDATPEELDKALKKIRGQGREPN